MFSSDQNHFFEERNLINVLSVINKEDNKIEN